MEDASTAGGKLSFGFTAVAKPKKAVVVHAEERKETRQLITGLEGSRIQTAEPEQNNAKTYVVPKLENTFKTGKKTFTPSFVPPTSDTKVGATDEKFEPAAQPDQPSITTYGLDIRQRQAMDAGDQAAASQPIDFRDLELQKLKEDMEQLPDEASLEAYEEMPVEQFGMALLRGMGWKDGEGVGKSRQLVEAKQSVRRPERLGLGANPVVVPQKPTVRKMGDKPKQDLVPALGADGRVRHTAGLDERLVPRSSVMRGPQPGKTMRIVSGRHEGLACVVLELLPKVEGRSDRASVRLQPSGETVELRCKELAETYDPHSNKSQQPASANGAAKRSTGSRTPDGEQHQAAQGSSHRHRPADERSSGRGTDTATAADHRQGDKERTGRGGSTPAAVAHEQPVSKRHKPGKHGRSSSSDHDTDGHEALGNGQQQQATWVARNIRVRIIDKHVRQGRLYLKKALVVDVHPGALCDVRVEETGQVSSLPQQLLETVVPKSAGAAVLVVGGDYKGRKGKLLQCSVSGGVAAVQLSGDLSVQRLLLDDVTEYLGAVDEEDD